MDGAAPARLRDLVPDDLDPVLALNRASEPGVGPLDAAGLAALVEVADVARVATMNGHVVGAIVALLPGRAYGSPNYRWFEASGVGFLYVDRIMVEAGRRSAGVGRQLYAETIALARAMGVPRVACEVNEDPPNPASLAFHIRLGFRGLTPRIDPRDGKRVLMMELPLP